MKITLQPTPNPKCEYCKATHGLCPEVYNTDTIDRILAEIETKRRSNSDYYEYNVYCLLSKTLKQLREMLNDQE